jgi:hypothetical protein
MAEGKGEDEMKYVVCDIDGTLTKVGDRLKCLEQTPKDWDSFYARCGEDEPNYPIIEMMEHFESSKAFDVILLTGRRESCKGTTKTWLYMNADKLYLSYILFRKDGDHRHDVEVKPELLFNFMESQELDASDIAFILEDRTSMVKKWRELGYTCLQVADGDF